MSFLTGLFDTTGFPARWHCGTAWAENPWLGWLHIFSDIGVGTAYVAIPLVLLYFLLRRKDLPFSKLFVLFGAFILTCGATHFIDAVLFSWPIYRFSIFMKLLTAIVSWATVFSLFGVVPRVMRMRSPEELEAEIAARKVAESELKELNDRLDEKIALRTRELTEANRALDEERQLLRTTLASIGDGVVVTDDAGNVTFLNGVAERLTGWKNVEAHGQPLEGVFRIFNESTREKVENPALRALREGVIMGLANHTVLVAKDGAEHPIDDSAAPIRMDDGAIRGAVLVFRDITDRKESLALLTEQEERLRLAVEATGLGIFDYSLETKKQTFTARCREILGIPRAGSVTIEDVLTLIHPEDRMSVHNAAKSAVDPHGSREFELAVRILDKEDIRWVLARGKAYFQETPEGPRATRMLGTLLDISERRQAEEAVRQSELRERERAAELDAVLQATPTPVFISHDAECHRITGNPAAYRLLQTPDGLNITASPSGPLQRTFQEYHRGRPVPSEELPLQKACAEGIEVRDSEFSFVFDDGHVRHVYGNAAPILNRDGTVRGGVAALMDITELKSTQEALVEADRRKNEFLATLAHELRNPLAPLRNSLEVLKQTDNDPAVLEQSRSTMERQLGQMVRLIDDLLDLSRITSNKFELRRERVELASILHHALEACRPLAEASNHEVFVELPDEPVWLHGDSVRLAQVLGNLLTNACKYTDPGGKVWIAVSIDGAEVEISVKDSGIGIPCDMLTRVFEMFTQVEPTFERSQGGLGIGLTLVKRLVDMHGGTVTAYSEGRGHGTEMKVRLPRLVDEPTPVAVVDSAPTPRASAQKILVVDDNRDAALTLAMLLRITGNVIKTAYDGLEAIEVAREFQPDVILLDIGLPKLNGYETCRAIRAQPGGDKIVMFALTGWGQDEDRRKSHEAGFDGHLVKPVEHATLLNALATTSRG
jgi:PAS domain S-box-containing protein